MASGASRINFSVAGVSVPRDEYNHVVSELTVVAGTEVRTLQVTSGCISVALCSFFSHVFSASCNVAYMIGLRAFT
jgi:hypothetical protein